MRVFAQKGFERATNKDIAREAGITPGLIYHYFKSKEDLFRAAVEERSPLRLVHSVSPQMLEAPPEALLRFIAQQILGIVEDERFVRLVRVFLPEVIYKPEMAPFGLSAIQEVVRFVESYLATKMQSGELRRTDASLTAQLFVGSLMALVLRRQVLRDPIALQYTHEQIVEGAVAVALQGLLPR